MKSAKAEGLILRAAIYARKSNDDNDKAAEDKSVARQIAHAREFIKRKGWTFAGEDHVYADDGVSGAEFKNREGLNNLLAALPQRGAPPFDVLVRSEHSRLGRDMRNTTGAFGEIIEAGVRVFFYLTDEELRLDTDEQEIMLSLRGYGSTGERSKAVAPREVPGWLSRLRPGWVQKQSKDEERVVIPSIFEVFNTSLDIVEMRVARSRLAGDPADVLLTPLLPDFGTMEFHRAAEAIQEGRAAVERMAPLIAEVIG